MKPPVSEDLEGEDAAKFTVEKVSMGTEGKDFFVPPPPLRLPKFAMLKERNFLRNKGGDEGLTDMTQSVSKYQKNPRSGSSTFRPKSLLLKELRELQVLVEGRDLRKSKVLQYRGEVPQLA